MTKNNASWVLVGRQIGQALVLGFLIELTRLIKHITTGTQTSLISSGLDLVTLVSAVFVGLWLWRWQFYFTPISEQVELKTTTKNKLGRLTIWSLTSSLLAKHHLKHLTSPVYSLIFFLVWIGLYLFVGFTSSSIFIKGVMVAFSISLVINLIDKLKHQDYPANFYLFLNLNYPIHITRLIIFIWIGLIIGLSFLLI